MTSPLLACHEAARASETALQAAKIALATKPMLFMGTMPAVEILEAMEIAHAKFYSYNGVENPRAWKYFCGICWKRIRQKEEPSGDAST